MGGETKKLNNGKIISMKTNKAKIIRYLPIVIAIQIILIVISTAGNFIEYAPNLFEKVLTLQFALTLATSTILAISSVLSLFSKNAKKDLSYVASIAALIFGLIVLYLSIVFIQIMLYPFMNIG